MNLLTNYRLHNKLHQHKNDKQVNRNIKTNTNIKKNGKQTIALLDIKTNTSIIRVHIHNWLLQSLIS